jgi:hypothetical protein
MKFFFSCCVALASHSALSSAFPTAASIANLARSGGLEIDDDLSFDEIVRQIKHQREKRLLVNSLNKPVKGMA